MSFSKKYEIFVPDDLCWLEVIYDCRDKSVRMRNIQAGDKTIILSDGTPHQLEQIIDILKHILKERHGIG